MIFPALQNACQELPRHKIKLSDFKADIFCEKADSMEVEDGGHFETFFAPYLQPYANKNELLLGIKKSLSKASLEGICSFAQQRAFLFEDEGLHQVLNFAYQWGCAALFNEVFLQLINRFRMEWPYTKEKQNLDLKQTRDRLFTLLGLKHLGAKNSHDSDLQTIQSRCNKLSLEILTHSDVDGTLCRDDIHSLTETCNYLFQNNEKEKRTFLEQLCYLGKSFEDGVFTDLAKQNAFGLYLFAAKQGLGYGHYILASHYESDASPLVKQDLKEAINWHMSGAGLGCGHSQIALAQYYREDKVVKKDIVFAQICLKNSAKKGFWSAHQSLFPLHGKRKGFHN